MYRAERRRAERERKKNDEVCKCCGHAVAHHATPGSARAEAMERQWQEMERLGAELDQLRKDAS